MYSNYLTQLAKKQVLKKKPFLKGLVESALCSGYGYSSKLTEGIRQYLEIMAVKSGQVFTTYTLPDKEELNQGDDLAMAVAPCSDGDFSLWSITRSLLHSGLLLAGETRSGKSSFLNNFLVQAIAKGMKTIVMDFKRSARRILAHPDINFDPRKVLVIKIREFPLNVLKESKGMDRIAYVSVLLDIFQHSYGLMIGSLSFFQDALVDLSKPYKVYKPNLRPCIPDLLELLDSRRIPRGGPMRDYYQRVKLRLKSIMHCFPQLAVSSGILEELIESEEPTCVVLELDGENIEAETFIVSTILVRLFFSRMYSENPQFDDIVVAFDDAPRLFNARATSGLYILSEIAAKVRAFKISLVVATQMPALMDIGILSNLSTKIALRMGGKDAYFMGQVMGLQTKEQVDELLKLQPGEGICRPGAGSLDPFRFYFPLLLDPKTVVTDKDIRMRLQPQKFLKRFKVAPRFSFSKLLETLPKKERENITKDVRKSSALTAIEKNFLVHVKDRPELFVRQRYKALHLGAWMGNRIKKKLIDQDLITDVPMSGGTKGGTKKMTVLTQRGCKVLRIGYPYEGKGKSGHKVVQLLVKYWYEKKGYEAHIERKIGEKSVDVVAEGNGEKIAIEVVGVNEKYEERNVRSLENLDKLIFVARTKDILKNTKKRLKDVLRKIPAKVDFKLVSEFLEEV